MVKQIVAQDSLLIFLSGSVSLNTQVSPPPPGNQPSDERILGFPPILAFHVEQSEQPLDIFGVGVDEATQ